MLKSAESKSQTLQQVLFQAMNTTIEIAFWGQENEVQSIEHLARDWFQNAEARFSRFQPESELNQLNRLAGQRSTVSAPMLEILLQAENYHKLTEGIFDPLIAKALQDTGYNESYEIVKQRGLISGVNRAPFRRGQHILIDPVTQSVQLPGQTEIDLGGIAKSWAVKGLADLFQDRLRLERGLINVGGDLRVWGKSWVERRPESRRVRTAYLFHQHRHDLGSIIRDHYGD
ncbi:MAG: FAD:protein FMN transferase [Desulfitobacteriaceae bacterium]